MSAHKQYVICPEQDCEWLVYMSDQNTSMVEALGIQDQPLWQIKESRTTMLGRRRPTRAPRPPRIHGYGRKAVLLNGLLPLPGDLPSVANLFLLIHLSARIQRKRVFHGDDLGEINVNKDYLYPDGTVIPCPVEKVEQLSPEQQPTYIQWILYCLNLDHKVDKDPRVYCSYCDMNNHPRFSCKHAFKHRNPLEKHHCTLAKHPPFLCARAQVNGGLGQPNWYKTEYKRAKSENREADYRWGPMVTHVDVDGPDSTSQHQSEAPQPVCAAAAMMHGMPMAPASSVYGGCPPIAEHQEFAPCMPPGMEMMQHDVIVPNPGYKIAANLWDLNIAQCVHAPSPLATFLCHCNTMESPYYPTYSKKGTSAPADAISDLNRSTSTIENLRELQKYSEKLAYESTCCRLWAEGIQTQIMDEQEKVQAWIAGMTEDLLRMKRIQHFQPAWTQHDA